MGAGNVDADSQSAVDPSWRNVLLVIPSISADLVELARPTLRELTQAGADVVVVANSASVAGLATNGDFRVADLKYNAGYSAAINAGADGAREWDWLIVLNDDSEFTWENLEVIRRRLAETDGQLILFDPGPWRSPRFRVFLDISLLTAALDRLNANKVARSARTYPGRFKEFSSFAVTKRVWSEVGELDERQVFWYEDAEYCRRVELLGYGPIVSLPVDLTSQRRSVTTSRHLTTVYPVGVMSARAFLLSSGRSRWAANAVIMAALVLRILLAPLAKTDPRHHYKAILRAFMVTVRGSDVRLPDYHSF